MITMRKRLVISLLFLASLSTIRAVDFTADERAYYIEEGQERERLKILDKIATTFQDNKKIPEADVAAVKKDSEVYTFQTYKIVVMNYLRKKATDFLKITARLTPGSWNITKTETYIPLYIKGLGVALGNNTLQKKLEDPKTSLNALLDPLTTSAIFGKLAPATTNPADKAALNAYLNYCLTLALINSNFIAEQKTQEDKTRALQQLEQIIKTWQLTLNPEQRNAVQPLINKVVELQKKPEPTPAPEPEPTPAPEPAPEPAPAPEPTPAPYTKPLPIPPVIPPTPPTKAPEKPQPPTRPTPPKPTKLHLDKQLLQTLHDDLNALARRL